MTDKTQLEAIKELLTEYACAFTGAHGRPGKHKRDNAAQQILDLCQPDIKACERITVIALKYCPKDHHDWEELKALSCKIIPSIVPGESE